MKRRIGRAELGAGLSLAALLCLVRIGSVGPGEVAVIRFAGSRSFRVAGSGVFLSPRGLESVAFVSLKPWRIAAAGGGDPRIDLPCPEGGHLGLVSRIRVRVPPRGVYQAVLNFGEKGLVEKASLAVEAKTRSLLRHAVGATGCRAAADRGPGADDLAGRTIRALADEFREKGLSIEGLELEPDG